MGWIEGLLGPTAFAAFIGLVTWFVQSRAEQAREGARRLHETRRKLYSQLLDPYIRAIAAQSALATAVTPENADALSQINQRLGSLDHRMLVFEMTMIGSDDVVRSYNEFARTFVDVRIAKRSDDPHRLLRNLAEMILAMRRNVGEEATNLRPYETIFTWVTDIEDVFPELRPRSALLEIERSPPAQQPSE